MKTENIIHINAETLKRSKFSEGRNLALTRSDGIKLFVTVKNAKIHSITAFDSAGNRLKVVIIFSESIANTIKIAKEKGKGKRKTKCEACIIFPNGRKECYPIDCNDLPSPKK